MPSARSDQRLIAVICITAHRCHLHHLQQRDLLDLEQQEEEENVQQDEQQRDEWQVTASGFLDLTRSISGGLASFSIDPDAHDQLAQAADLPRSPPDLACVCD